MPPKRVRAVVKVHVQAGQATPAPPVGPALGQHGVNIMQFVKEYNARTVGQTGSIVPAEITIFEDRSFTFITKTPPASTLLMKAAGLEKGSETPGREPVGVVTMAQLREIAEAKMEDLNANDVDAAIQMIAGTARSMGIEVSE